MEALEKVPLTPEEPEKQVTVGADIPPDIRREIVACLRRTGSSFAWSNKDMVGIDPSIITHSLNIDVKHVPVKQKRRKYALERNHVVNEEIQSLLETGKIREVSYPDWLANVVMVPKKNGKWRVCVDCTDLNKACPNQNRGRN